MQRYKMIVAYDGTDYAGWVQQPAQRSVVQTLHDAFTHVFKKPVKILGASKTDAGVHALGQVAILSTELVIEPSKMQWAWNNALPLSIAIRSLEHAATFHPHYNVISKTYQYHLFFERPLPLHARYGTYIPYSLDREKFAAALSLFCGTHDFAAFCTREDERSTIRTITDIQLSYIATYNAYRVTIMGEKFLRHMVRRMVGAALAVASHEHLALEVITTALATQRVTYELPTAPAQGLLLHSIAYRNAHEANE
jgi:tRNA pseudouridine38-40 synthase